MKATEQELQKIQEAMTTRIPILRELGVQLRDLSSHESLLFLPLEPNRNHKGTAFGGSLYAACTAGCYAFIYLLQIRLHLEDWDLVIVEGQMKYLRPVEQDFLVSSHILMPPKWDSATLRQRLIEKKKVRLHLQSNIHPAKSEPSPRLLARFEGDFTFVPRD